MPLSRVTTNGHGHVKIDTKDKTSNAVGSVNSDGQVNVKFHSNPQQLVQYFNRFESEFCPLSKPKPAHHHNQFSDEKAAGPGPGPGPRLNIAIHIVGSRGDVQPFIPIAKLLIANHGHRVRICTHPNFKDFVESNGIEFFSIGGDPEALMAYMVKNPGLLPSRESVKVGDIGKRKREMSEIINGCWRSCIEAGDGMGERIRAANVASPKDLFIADAIIANPPSMAHIHCAEKLSIPLHMVFTMPWSPTTKFHHPLAAMNYGEADTSVANYLSFMMMELLTWEGLGDVINVFRTDTLKLDSVSPLWGYQLIPRLRVPYTYLWSQALVPKPDDWDDHINIAGFSFLEQASSYVPLDDLTKFLERGPKPIYIGFGSIVVDDPKALNALIVKAVELAGVRCILSKGWGGLGEGDLPDTIYAIGNCPHDWLFEQVSAVVHHGGAGTTAAGLALGKPTVVVPFFGDQPFWGQMIAKAGAGPTPVPFKQMTADSLAESIRFALAPKVQAAVQEMANQIAREDGARDATINIEGRVKADFFRCDLFPERLAIWHHRKSGAQLSGFAVCALIQNELIKRHHLEPIRRTHWYVDEGAEFPIIGMVAAVTSAIRGISIATSAYKRRLKPRPTPDVEQSRRLSAVEGLPEEWHPGQPITPKQMEVLAEKIAKRTGNSRTLDTLSSKMPTRAFTNSSKKSPQQRNAIVKEKKEEKEHGRFYQTSRATGLYAFDVTKVGLKFPVAFWYNLANGCHNMPSYGLWSVQVRRRDEITGLGSGVKTAGKEFVLGFYDAFSGLVVLPYQGAKAEGGKGFGKGVLQAWRSLLMNIGAATFGVPGYTLKGIEKQCMKYGLPKLRAEILLIRLRKTIDEYQHAPEEEIAEACRRWKSLHP